MSLAVEEKKVAKYPLDKIELGIITEQEIRAAAKKGFIFKGYNCYFINLNSLKDEMLKNYYGFSILIYKNGRSIRHANDFQIHHASKTEEELENYYEQQLNGNGFFKALYTDDEILEDPIKNYNDYKQKDYFIRNYLPLEYESISAFYIGNPSKEQEEAHKKYYYSKSSFTYFKDEEAVDRIEKLEAALQEKYDNYIKSSDKFFYNSLLSELYNHEAGLTQNPQEALSALGINYNSLSQDRKNLVFAALKECIKNTNC